MTDQKQMCFHAMSHPTRLFFAFMEIQESGNPLSPAEIRRLIDKHPSRYQYLEGYAEPKAGEPAEPAESES